MSSPTEPTRTHQRTDDTETTDSSTDAPQLSRRPRRRFLQAVATASLGIPVIGTARATETTPDLEQFVDTYFDTLRATSDRPQVVTGCANELCRTTRLISRDALDTVAATGKGADEVMQQAQFGVKILNEYQLTDAIDESMVAAHRWEVSDYTRYIPLLASFNNLRTAACKVTPENGESTKQFLIASLAFGIEVALWTYGTPYRMAWRGTRFVANRTFLRFAQHGCTGCIALAMSELHWAIRASVYGDIVTENNIEFVVNQINEINRFAAREGYAQIDLDRQSIVSVLKDTSHEGGAAMGPISDTGGKGIFDRLFGGFNIGSLWDGLFG